MNVFGCFVEQLFWKLLSRVLRQRELRYSYLGNFVDKFHFNSTKIDPNQISSMIYCNLDIYSIYYYLDTYYCNRPGLKITINLKNLLKKFSFLFLLHNLKG